MSFLTRRRSQDSMRNLYNWFCSWYGLTEKVLDAPVSKVIDRVIVNIPDVQSKTAIEYACGSGLLTLKLAKIFSQVEGYDQSMGMLTRARKRAREHMLDVHYFEGDILAIEKNDKSYDWAFVSFALHLFAPGDETLILKKLLAVAREGVMIIDHSKRWNPAAAFVEWLEGSHYDAFVRVDFEDVARRIGASSFKEMDIDGTSVMIFYV